jgi:hypothetical protein
MAMLICPTSYFLKIKRKRKRKAMMILPKRISLIAEGLQKWRGELGWTASNK